MKQPTKRRVATVAKTVKLPEPLNERLRKFSFKRNLSQQDVILAAIQHYMEVAESWKQRP